MAAVVGVKLYEAFMTHIPRQTKVWFWCDSEAVLKWISGTRQWPVFVENRVAFIRKLGLCDRFRYANTVDGRIR